MDSSVEAVLRKFLTAPKGTDSSAIVAKVRHWIDVANHPEHFSQDQNPYAVAAKRRNAKQNIRRLLMKHPQLASALVGGAEESQ